MAETKITYSSSLDMTVTSWGNGLASGQIGASAAEDNGTPLYVDALVGGLVEVGASAPAAGDTHDLYAYGQYDPDTASAFGGGIDGLFTGADEEEVDDTDLLLAHIPLLVSLQTESNVGFHFGPHSVAARYSGRMPESWGVIMHNNGSATNASGSLANYLGATYTTA